jgi:cytochrome c oxidase subunit III
MSMFNQLMVKPWSTDQSKVDDLYAGGASSGFAKKIALRVFLAVVAVLFMLLLVAYGGRMAYEDWRPAPQIRLVDGWMPCESACLLPALSPLFFCSGNYWPGAN